LASAFDKVDERIRNHFIPSGGGISTGKVPVAFIIWACQMKILNGLEYNFHLGSDTPWRNDLRYFIGNL
jgi:hypothetical protein